MSHPSQLPEDMTGVIVSNSETSDFLLCERKHYYGYGLKIQSKDFGTSLHRGLMGHEALAVYYKARLEGADHREAVKAFEAWIPVMMLKLDDWELLSTLVVLLRDYFAHVADERIKVLAVEQDYFLRLSGTNGYAMRIDLLVEPLDGPNKGRPELWDHKFVYNFYTGETVMLNAQMPKYIAALRMLGIDVLIGRFNQLRYRTTKNQTIPDKFQRYEMRPSVAELKGVFREHLESSERVIARRSLPLAEQEQQARRLMHPTICSYCQFRYLCKTQLVGGNVDLMLETDFVPRDYGYNEADYAGATQ